MDDLVNVVIGVVVDASVNAFTAQTVTLVFASLGVIFNANLFHLAFFFSMNKRRAVVFVPRCPCWLRLEMAQQERQSAPKLTLHVNLSCSW